MDSIVLLADIRRTDTLMAGGKGANLGELTARRLPGAARLRRHCRGLPRVHGRRPACARRSPRRSTADDPAAWARADERQALVRKAGLRDRRPRGAGPRLRRARRSAWARQAPAVAVRSSATAEDAADTSFAGMNKTFTNVRGADAVADAVVEAWASLFGERVVAYRADRQHPGRAGHRRRRAGHGAGGLVRRGVHRRPGQRSTRHRIVIEGAFGQGEVVVGGRVEPDTYVVDKATLEILRGAHRDQVAQDRGRRRRRRPVDAGAAEAAAARCSRREAVVEVARLAAAIEAHYGVPQDVEWCLDAAGELHVVQTRPITTLGSDRAASTGRRRRASVLVRGLGASPGVAAGAARLLREPSEGRSLLDGEVLVAPMTNPDWLPTMRRAAAVVTDGGGITCHAAIVSRGARHPLRRRRSHGHRRPSSDGADRDGRRRRPAWCCDGAAGRPRGRRRPPGAGRPRPQPPAA